MSSPTTITYEGAVHTLLRWLPDWTNKPAWEGTWLTGIAEGVTKGEDRVALRPRKLISLKVTLAEDYEANRIQLMEDLLSAQESGLAAIPYYGRGTPIVSVSGTEATVSNNLWPWQSLDNALCLSFDRQTPVWQHLVVQSVGVGTITVDQSLSETYPFIWPLIFGKFTSGEISVLNDEDGEIEVEVAQRNPFPVPLAGSSS